MQGQGSVDVLKDAGLSNGTARLAPAIVMREMKVKGEVPHLVDRNHRLHSKSDFFPRRAFSFYECHQLQAETVADSTPSYNTVILFDVESPYARLRNVVVLATTLSESDIFPTNSMMCLPVCAALPRNI